MATELCRHELPTQLCDVCTPRQIERPRSSRGSDRVAQPKVPDPDTVIVAANFAYGEYLNYRAYVCQPDRPFRKDVRWMGFYAEEAIQREIPEILYVRDRVPFSKNEVERLRSAEDEVGTRLADLIERLATHSTRRWDEDFKVFLLSAPDDQRTHRLPNKVVNNLLDHKGTGTAFTQHQRYTKLSFLEAGPKFTDDLIAGGAVTDEQKSTTSDQ